MALATEKKRGILKRIFDKLKSTATNFLGGKESLYKSSFLKNVKNKNQVDITNKDVKSVDTTSPEYIKYVEKIKADEAARAKRNKAAGL
ncbi:MAG: hypothetical protein WC346_10010 [Methanogenium sp.]|jgi:hypothetical protein